MGSYNRHNKCPRQLLYNEFFQRPHSCASVRLHPPPSPPISHLKRISSVPLGFDQPSSTAPVLFFQHTKNNKKYIPRRCQQK